MDEPTLQNRATSDLQRFEQLVLAATGDSWNIGKQLLLQSWWPGDLGQSCARVVTKLKEAVNNRNHLKVQDDNALIAAYKYAMEVELLQWNSHFYLAGLKEAYDLLAMTWDDIQHSRIRVTQRNIAPQVTLNYIIPQVIPNNIAPQPIPHGPGINMDSHGQIDIQAPIPYNALVFGDKIGGGTYGDVYKGTYWNNYVAIKVLKAPIITNDHIDEFKREAALMAKFNSPYIIRILGACFAPQYALVMEYMPKGSLYSFLQNQPIPNWKIRYQIGIDTGKGITCLHHANIVHADLKSLNVLIDNDNHAKVADFGLSKIKLASSATLTHMGPTHGGTLRWSAPELFSLDTNANKNTTKSDMYSYGMILWELGARKIPFCEKAPQNFQVPNLLQAGVREDITQDTPPSMANLIGRCWNQRAEQRPDISETVQNLEEEFNRHQFN